MLHPALVLALALSQAAPAVSDGSVELEEIAEPNEDGRASFAAPSVGERVTLRGCITPLDLEGDEIMDADIDSWTMSSDGPVLLRLRVEGAEGLAPGFSVLPSQSMAAVHGWHRVGADFEGSTSSEDVFVPANGTYLVSIFDTRSLLFGIPAGSGATCYELTVSAEPVPSATLLRAGEAVELQGPAYRWFPANESVEYEITLEGATSLSEPVVSVLLQGQYLGSFLPEADGVVRVALGPLLEGQVVLVVDYLADAAVEPPTLTMTLREQAVGAQEPEQPSETPEDRRL